MALIPPHTSIYLSKTLKKSSISIKRPLKCSSTGWLKLKYPTGQNAISRQPCDIFIPKFLDLYGRDPATNLIFF